METSTSTGVAEPTSAVSNHSSSTYNRRNSSHPHDHHHHHLLATLSSTSILIIIICTVTVILLLAILLIILMLRRVNNSKSRRFFKDNGSIHNNSSRFISHTTINFSVSPDVKGGCLYGGNLGHKPQGKRRGVQVFTYKDLEAATDEFSEANVIGKGGYGVVYKGILNDGTVAAIKMLLREGKQGERAFRMEVDLLSRLDSPYLVELLGYCADQHHRLLIFEFMPNCTLQQHLHNKHYRPLDWATRLRIALDCAKALEFLHEHTTPPVIHRDFKCTNILLDPNFGAKISDFGLAKIGSDKIDGQISTRVLGTTGYLAPEYASTGKLTTKSDVYSYGVVLLQLLTGRTPIDSNRPAGEQVLVSWALPRLTDREKMVEMVDPSLQAQCSKKDLIQVVAIAAMCVQPEADYRPLMTDVVQSLIPLVKNLSSVSSAASSQHQTPSRRSSGKLMN